MAIIVMMMSLERRDQGDGRRAVPIEVPFVTTSRDVSVVVLGRQAKTETLPSGLSMVYTNAPHNVSLRGGIE